MFCSLACLDACRRKKTYLIVGASGICSLRCGAVASFMVEQRRWEAEVVAVGKTCVSLISLQVNRNLKINY